MSITNPEDHEYDWISATEECSVACEFAQLQDNARRCVETRNQKINDSSEKFTLEVVTESKFLVRSCSGHFVSFASHSDFIEVQCADLVGDHGTTPYSLCRLSLTLNEEAELRYRINGKGEHLRWQVMKHTLKNLLFLLPRQLESTPN
ncbi:MAG: hypothetical protein OXB98_05960 [Bryobacterales bacterium]|nr:hypothetical protein [Bryobacterales bacterium]